MTRELNSSHNKYISSDINNNMCRKHTVTDIDASSWKEELQIHRLIDYKDITIGKKYTTWGMGEKPMSLGQNNILFIVEPKEARNVNATIYKEKGEKSIWIVYGFFVEHINQNNPTDKHGRSNIRYVEMVGNQIILAEVTHSPENIITFKLNDEQYTAFSNYDAGYRTYNELIDNIDIKHNTYQCSPRISDSGMLYVQCAKLDEEVFRFKERLHNRGLLNENKNL